MIKLIATGVWICLVTVAASYAAIFWRSETTPEAEADKFFGGLQSIKTNLISVPVIGGQGLQGYVLAQFTFTMKADLLRTMSVKPDVYLLDAAFRTIYGGDAAQMRGAKKQDLEALTKSIKAHVNERFGQPFVDEVLIEKYTYLSKEEVRGGANLVKMDAKFAR